MCAIKNKSIDMKWISVKDELPPYAQWVMVRYVWLKEDNGNPAGYATGKARRCCWEDWVFEDGKSTFTPLWWCNYPPDPVDESA